MNKKRIVEIFIYQIYLLSGLFMLLNLILYFNYIIYHRSSYSSDRNIFYKEFLKKF